jgi:methylmalonyl-CoA mutase C-terminal domain/subunit
MEIRKDPAEFAQNRSDSTASDNQQARRAPDIGRRRIRVLIAKAGLDGHDRGAKVVAAALRDAGMEVIYTGLRQTPEMIVEAAIQEDVDVIGISLLSGAHMTIFPKILTLMKEKGLTGVLLFGGGIIPEKDITALKELGVGELFTPGTLTTEIVSYVRSWKDSKEETQRPTK